MPYALLKNVKRDLKMTILKDKDIREPLFDYLENQYGTVRFLEEKQIGRSRSDIVMVLPEALCGIEIKSDADTYARLARQVKDYDKYYDYNMVVVGSTHAHHIDEHVPKHWGILIVELEEDTVDFYLQREMKPNPKMKINRKITLLWRPELVHIQQRHAMFAYKQKSKRFVQEKILEKIPEDVLHQEISKEMFERDYTLIAQEIEDYKNQ